MRYEGLGWCGGYIESFNIKFPNDYDLLEMGDEHQLFKPESDVDDEERETEGSE